MAPRPHSPVVLAHRARERAAEQARVAEYVANYVPRRNPTPWADLSTLRAAIAGLSEEDRFARWGGPARGYSYSPPEDADGAYRGKPRWFCTVMVAGRNVYLGSFYSELDAWVVARTARTLLCEHGAAALVDDFPSVLRRTLGVQSAGEVDDRLRPRWLAEVAV